MNKKLSIIIPCFNVEKYIQRCIDSLINQTLNLNDVELIFVNDASTDKTLEILNRNEQKYEENMLVVVLEQHAGVSSARNIGLSYATGEYIAFIDSDDYVAPNMFEFLIKWADSENCDFVSCKIKKVTDEDVQDTSTSKLFTEDPDIINCNTKIYCLSNDEIRKDAIANYRFSTSVCDKIYKKSFIDKYAIDFPEDVRYEDTYFSYLVLSHAEKAVLIDCPLYFYYFNPKSIMRGGDAKSQLERLESCELLLNQLKSRACNSSNEISLLEAYYLEWEIVFIKKYYTEVINFMIIALEKIPYELYQYICNFMKREFPNFPHNKYLKQPENSIERLYLTAFGLSEEQLESVKKIISKTVGK